MAQFPPLAACAVQADYAGRLADLQRLSLLPPLAVKAVHLIMATHRWGCWEATLGAGSGGRSLCQGLQPDSDVRKPLGTCTMADDVP